MSNRIAESEADDVGNDSIGRQDYEKVRINDNFFIDKTDFIRFNQFSFPAESDRLNENEKMIYQQFSKGTGDRMEAGSLKTLSNYAM